jgi:hypothetical protein
LAKNNITELKTCWFHYQPSPEMPELDLYFGGDKSGFPLIYNFKNNNFKLNTNPYGEKHEIDLKKIEIENDNSKLTLMANDLKQKSIMFYVNHDSNKIFVKFLKSIIDKSFPKMKMNPDDTHIHIGMNNGILIEFQTTEYDNNHNIIPLKGLKIKTQEYNSEGKPDNYDNKLRILPIISEKFIYYNYDDKSVNTIKNLYIKDDKIITETENKIFKNNLKTNDFVYNFVVEIINTRLPFKSKYE